MSIEPVDLNLPSKFKEFRQNQLQVAMKAVSSKHYAFLLDSPTGTGKSIIAATVQRLLNKNVIYLCLTGNNTVRTSKGIKSVKDILIGDTIVNRFGEFEDVTRISSRLHTGKIVKIKTYYGTDEYLELTPEHEIQTWNKDLEWKSAWQIKKGDLLTYPIVPICNKLPYDVDLVKLFCWFITEGSIGSHGQTVCLTLGNHEVEKVDKIIEIIKNTRGILAYAYPKPTSTINIEFHDAELASILEAECGRGALNKHLPTWMLLLSQDYSKTILDELVSGDGHNWNQSGEERNSYTTSSRILALDVRDLAFRAGYFPSMFRMEADTTFGHQVNYRVAYRNEATKNRCFYGDKISNVVRMKVRQVEIADFNDTVYDITTGNSESFSTVNAAIHNCTTKQLQTQLISDFPYARVLMGRANYPCAKYFSMWPEVTAEMCNDGKESECGYKDNCAYKKAKMAAIMAPIAILNMAYFLTEINYGKTFSGSEYVIIDEFDSTEDQLMGYIACDISAYTLKTLQLEQPKYKTKFESWIDWANDTIKLIEPQIDTMEKDMMSPWYQPDAKTNRHLIQLKRFDSKLNFLVRNVSDRWVFYPSEQSWSFKPIWIAPYADSQLWKHMKKVLGMSATILEPRQAAKNIGLEDYEYLALPSPFPKENRPIEFIPCGNVIEKELITALPMLAKKVDEIIRANPHDKILCHTVSYKIRDYLLTHVKTDRFITHQQRDKAEKLEEYKRSNRPLVMVSPSMDRGVDLPGDQCRVVIICKVPYPNLGDPQINKRLYGSKDGRFWYAYQTIKTVIQMCGRGVRSKEDWAKTYILDGQFDRLYKDHPNMWPEWFREAIIY